KKDYLNRSDQFQSHPYFWAAFVANGDMKSLEMEEPGFDFKWALGLLIVLLVGLSLFRLKKKSS
ncbi:MAG: hypothetical protein AAF696_36975, partial [Bacteroidota bacterium]